MTARLWIGTLVMPVTHFAGCRRLSAVIRNAARRNTTQCCDRITETDKPKYRRRKTGAANDGRWYVLLCNRVHLGVGDKMSALDVNLRLHGHALDVVVCELICDWRIRQLERCIERLEQGLLGRRRQRACR